MSARIKSTKATNQGCLLHMEERNIMLKLAGILWEKELISYDEKIELMKMINNRKDS